MAQPRVKLHCCSNPLNYAHHHLCMLWLWLWLWLWLDILLPLHFWILFVVSRLWLLHWRRRLLKICSSSFCLIHDAGKPGHATVPFFAWQSHPATHPHPCLQGWPIWFSFTVSFPRTHTNTHTQTLTQTHTHTEHKAGHTHPFLLH